MRKLPFASVRANRGPKPPIESIDAWWHPGRPGVPLGPSYFRAQLADFDPDLELTWNPLKEQYQMFMRAPRMAHKICWGWLYLFSVPPDQLDNRVFARLYSASSRKWGGAKPYFEAIEREILRDREQRRAAQLDDTLQRAGDFYDHTKISTAGTGSKFSQYHS